MGSNISRSTVAGGRLQISLINTREAGFPRPFVLTIGIPDGTGINCSVDWVTDRWTSNHTLCVCNIRSILVCIVRLQKLMMTSVSYRYSNDDKKMELREVVMDKLGSSLTLAFIRTVKWVTSHLLTEAVAGSTSYACHSWEERRQLKCCQDRAISRTQRGAQICGSELQNICAFSNGPQVSAILFINKMAYKAYVGLN